MLESRTRSNGEHNRSQFLKDLEKRIASREHVDMKELVADVAEQLESSSMAKTLMKSAARVNDSAHAKPWYFIAGAVVGGFVIGALLRR